MNQLRGLIRSWNTYKRALSMNFATAPERLDDIAKQAVLSDCNLAGKSVPRGIIYLRSPGCEYLLKTSGCSMCHTDLDSTAGRPISAAALTRQFEDALMKFAGNIPPVLCLYNGGSSFNPNELPWKTFQYMLSRIREVSKVKRLIIESRLEYLTEPRLREALVILGGDVELEIGIGLESSSDLVRNDILLKSVSLETFERKLLLLKSLGVRTLSYVVLKPPFLCEAEAIHDTVSSARYAFQVGSNAVSIEPISVGAGTITEDLFTNGEFQPPRLWSMLECAKQLQGYGELRLGGYQYVPVGRIIETLPSNCSACDAIVIDRIAEYNRSLMLNSLDFECTNCYEPWLLQLKSEDVVLKPQAILKKALQVISKTGLSVETTGTVVTVVP